MNKKYKNKILYLQFYNPALYPPLEHSSAILKKDGWDVLFVGVYNPQNSILIPQDHPSVRHIKIKVPSKGIMLKLKHSWFVICSFFCVLLWRPKWLYVSDSIAAPTALILKLLFPISVIYHEHDFPDVKRDHQLSWSYRVVLNVRKKLAQMANFCVLPQKIRAEKFREETRSRKPILCVYNCPLISEVIQYPKSSTGSKLKLIYQGSINSLRLPGSLLEALAKMPEMFEFSIVGYETQPGYLTWFMREVRRLELGDCIEYAGIKARPHLLNLCAEFDVGVSLMPRSDPNWNMKYMAGASNKAFDFLSQGLALLVSDIPEWNEMYVNQGYGLACIPENADSIFSVLKWFRENRAEVRAMGERGRQRILKDWNYEYQFHPVRSKINAAERNKR